VDTEKDQSQQTPRKRKSSKERNAEIIAALEPLADGERPKAVTVAAVLAGLLGVATLVIYFGVLDSDSNASLIRSIAFSGVMLVASVGMFMSKYWAVLGFQVILGLAIVLSSILLIVAQNLVAVLLTMLVGVSSGILFWKLIKAMARIQMPSIHRESKVGSK